MPSVDAVHTLFCVHTQLTPMKTEKCREAAASEPQDAVGIVVTSGKREGTPPRAVAFMWGARVAPVPSLPYGRWKRPIPTAA